MKYQTKFANVTKMSFDEVMYDLELSPAEVRLNGKLIDMVGGVNVQINRNVPDGVAVYHYPGYRPSENMTLTVHPEAMEMLKGMMSI